MARRRRAVKTQKHLRAFGAPRHHDSGAAQGARARRAQRGVVDLLSSPTGAADRVLYFRTFYPVCHVLRYLRPQRATSTAPGVGRLREVKASKNADVSSPMDSPTRPGSWNSCWSFDENRATPTPRGWLRRLAYLCLDKRYSAVVLLRLTQYHYDRGHLNRSTIDGSITIHRDTTPSTP